MYYGGKGVTQNYETAIKWYKLAAKQGLAKAQNHLERLQKKISKLENVQKGIRHGIYVASFLNWIRSLAMR